MHMLLHVGCAVLQSGRQSPLMQPLRDTDESARSSSLQSKAKRNSIRDLALSTRYERAGYAVSAGGVKDFATDNMARAWHGRATRSIDWVIVFARTRMYICNVRRTTYNVQRATCNARRPAYMMRQWVHSIHGVAGARRRCRRQRRIRTTMSVRCLSAGWLRASCRQRRRD
jgi:hypothetical protein